jgi:hypothetical protein
LSIIKYRRAKAHSAIGNLPGSFDAMWGHIPADVRKALTSREIAAMIDGLWQCANESKAEAEREVVWNGFVWNEANGKTVALAS